MEHNSRPRLWSSRTSVLAAQPSTSIANTLGTTLAASPHCCHRETTLAALPATTQESGLLTCVGKIEGHADGGVVLGGYDGVRGVEKHPIRPQQCLHLFLQALPHAHQLGLPTKVEVHQLLCQSQGCSKKQKWGQQ